MFQSQPKGPGPFFRSAALSVTYVAWLHGATDVLLNKKMASGSDGPKHEGRLLPFLGSFAANSGDYLTKMPVKMGKMSVATVA